MRPSTFAVAPLSAALLALSVVCAPAPALAAPQFGGVERSFTGSIAEIDDRDADATGPAVTILSLTVPAIPQDTITGFKEFFINFEHTFVGDLVITLSHVDAKGASIVLVDRPGFPPLPFGNSDDVQGLYRFVDTSASSAFPEFPTGAGSIAPGTYNVAGPGRFSDFLGESAAGEWRLIIEDWTHLDSGRVLSWGFTVNTIPAPGAAALGLAAAPLAVRRRRA
jgi:hypothetical protein